MGRKTANLAGLAALAGVAYANRDKLSSLFGGKRPARPESVETRDEEPRRKITDYIKKAPADTAGPVSSEPVVTRSAAPKVAPAPKPAPKPAPEPVVTSDRNEDYGNEGRTSARSSSASPTYMSKTPGGDAKRTEGNQSMPSLKAVENRIASNKTDAMRNASRSQVRKANLSPIDQIPGQDRSGPTGGERVSGTELSRNVSNTLAALTPLGGGVGKIGAELATAGRAQRGYNAAQAARRSAEGMSPAEALAAREAAAQAAREAKTLNPNAWLAGPKGMAENFRKGGAVKKMASGGMTASRRADGIASRGKTRCKMY